MKEKIKQTLFVASVLYSLTIVILMGFAVLNMTEKVDLHDSEENQKTLISYKEQLSNLEQTECVKVIKKIVEHYENTSYNGPVKLSDMYEFDFENSILSYYFDVKDKCKISTDEEKKYNLPTKFITASIQRDEIYQSYYFQYEMNIKDLSIRLLVEPGLSGVEYKINRNMELEIISALTEISKKEDITNE